MNQPIVTRIFPLGFNWETRDPFLFCVHHLDHFPAGNDELGPPAEALRGRNIGNDFEPKDGWRMYHGDKVPGFPVHPHRGFETVTMVLRGFVDHADSMGAAGRYGTGDTQWMTAGAGIQHSEMFPLVNADKENTLELFQIWLNLPQAAKFVRPHYKMLWREDIPVRRVEDASGHVVEMRVIADASDRDVPAPPPDSWATDPSHEVVIRVVRIDAAAVWRLPQASPGLHRNLYVFEGDAVVIDERPIPPYHGVELRSDAEAVVANKGGPARLLLLQGKPIAQKVAQYGPFVMNDEAEIREAYEDYRRTRFGGWPWDRNDPVQPREAGRFAEHDDGDEESPE